MHVAVHKGVVQQLEQVASEQVVSAVLEPLGQLPGQGNLLGGGGGMVHLQAPEILLVAQLEGMCDIVAAFHSAAAAAAEVIPGIADLQSFCDKEEQKLGFVAAFTFVPIRRAVIMPREPDKVPDGAAQLLAGFHAIQLSILFEYAFISFH